MREVEILKMVAEGRTTQEIADALFVSPKTVQAHRANMMAKLDVHNSAALVRYAMQKGLIHI
jgi:DNA-binding CsgD family transcriptional regulator